MSYLCDDEDGDKKIVKAGDVRSEIVFDDHDKATTHMNSHRLWLHVKTHTRPSQHEWRRAFEVVLL